MNKLLLAIALIFSAYSVAYAQNMPTPNPNNVNGNGNSFALPSQSGKSGDVLSTNGTNPLWISTSGNGSSPLRSVPSNQWSGVNVYGAADSYNELFTPLSNGYGALVAKQLGTSPTYYVYNTLSGSYPAFSEGNCDVVEGQIIPNTNPQLQGNPVGLMLTGSGEPSFGAGSYQAHLIDLGTCLMGGLTWATVPAQYKVNAQSASCVQTGTWTNSTHYSNVNANGVTSDTQGSALTCTVFSPGGPFYLWFLMHMNDGGTFTYSLDGGPTTSVATQGQNAFTYPPASNITNSFGAVRIPATSGNHTLAINVTSATSASNTVTIEGIGTPPYKAYASTSPVFALSGQITDEAYPAASAAFNAAFQNLTKQLLADGLQTLFANVLAYYNVSTDKANIGGNTLLTSTGQQHISDAFNGALQGSWNSMFAVNPLQFGASCNSLYFPSSYTPSGKDNSVTTTQGSNVITIKNYVFQPGIATQFGGGDVGKRICIGPGGVDVGPCTYIASVLPYDASTNPSNNKATVGALMANSTTSGNATMGGYPTNPNDPSTAADDDAWLSMSILAAANGGGKVALPSNCMLHAFTPPQLPDGSAYPSVIVEGNSPGDTYWYGGQQASSGPVAATVLNCGITGYSSDSQFCVQTTPAVMWKNIYFRAPVFPYTPNNISAACLGYSTVSNSGPGSQILTESNDYFGCPVSVGQAYGYNHPVVFNGALTPIGTSATSSMYVSAITSTNFQTADNWGTSDFLGLNRTFSTSSFSASVSGTVMNVTSVASGVLGVGQAVSGPSVPSSALITALGTGIGTTGTYILNQSLSIGTASGFSTQSTITSVDPTNNDTTGNYVVTGAVTLGTTSLTSPANTQGMELRDKFSQHFTVGIAYNGDFTDSVIEKSTCTGTFMNGCWRIGPALASYGSGGNRWLGGRAEEQAYSAFTIDGGQLIMTGADIQFNGGYNIRTLGSNANVQMTGGYMYAGGHCSGFHNSMIRLGGTNPTVSVDGVGLEAADYGSGCGGSTNYLFASETGSTLGGPISVTGGGTKPSVSPVTGLYDWTNGTPSLYKQETAGWPPIDTTQTVLAITAAGNIGIGTGTPLNQLDVYSGGIHIGSSIPLNTSNTLYANGSSIYWNGAAIGTSASLFGPLFANVSGTYVNPSVASVAYNWGDSITLGTGTSVSSQAWANLFDNDVVLNVPTPSTTYNANNYGIGGEMACDMGYSEVFTHSNPATSVNALNTIMIGTNESFYKGVGSYEAIYNGCLEASIAWVTIPSAYKTAAQSCTKTGTWVNDTTPQTGYGVSSTTNGSTLTCSITTNGNPLIIWYRAIDSNGGTFTYAVDGGSAVPVSNTTSPSISTQNGGTTGLLPVIITGVSAATHSVVFNVTSTTSGSNIVDIWGLGSPAPAPYNTQNVALVSGVIYEQNNGNSAATAQYNADALADAALMASYGLPVLSVNVRNYINSTTDMYDTYHPNNVGHNKLWRAFEIAGQLVARPQAPITNISSNTGSLNVNPGAIAPSSASSNLAPGLLFFGATHLFGADIGYNTAASSYTTRIFGSSSLGSVVEIGGMADGATIQSNFTSNAIFKGATVGLGTSTPVNRLDVSGAVAIGTGYAGANTAPTNGLLVQGNVAIGTTLAQGPLDVFGLASGAITSDYACYDTANGVFTYQTSNCTASLRELKDNIQPYTTGLADALALKPSTFFMKNEHNLGEEVGLIAQDTEKVNKDLAVYQDGKLRSVQYDRLGVVAIAAIQEQQKEIEATTGAFPFHKCHSWYYQTVSFFTGETQLCAD